MILMSCIINLKHSHAGSNQLVYTTTMLIRKYRLTAKQTNKQQPKLYAIIY